MDKSQVTGSYISGPWPMNLVEYENVEDNEESIG